MRESARTCPACGRADFGGGQRCQYCTQPLVEETETAPADDLGFDLEALAGAAPAAAATEEGAPPTTATALPPRASRGGLWGTVALLGIFLFKMKSVLLFLLLKAKSLLFLLKGAKFLTTGLSMLASMWLQAQIHGWKFAVGFIGLIFVHEMGHVWAIRRKGLPASAPVFIPFVGALITLKKMPQDAATEAAIALGGPAAGTLGGIFCLGAYYLTGWAPLLPIAYFTFFINLFNLVPVSPLDGGRIAAAISPGIWWLGVPLLILLGVRTDSPIIWLILFLGIARALTTRQETSYYQVPATTRRNFGLAYLSLAALVGVLTLQTHQLGAQAGLYAHTESRQEASPAPASVSPERAAPDDASPRLALDAPERPSKPPATPAWKLALVLFICVASWVIIALLAALATNGFSGHRAAEVALVFAVVLVLGLRAAGVTGLPKLVLAYLILCATIFCAVYVGIQRHPAHGQMTARHRWRLALQLLLVGMVLALLALTVTWLLLLLAAALLVLLLRKPALPAALFVQARYARQPERAVALFERLLRWRWLSRRERFLIHVELSGQYGRLGQCAPIIEHARAAIALADAWPELEVGARANLAEALSDLGRYEEAAAECARFFALVDAGICWGNRTRWRQIGRSLLAQINLERGVLDEALLQAEWALKGLDPQLPLHSTLRNVASMAHWCRAEALRAQGDPQGAEEACDQAVAYLPGTWVLSHLLSARAAARYAQGRWQEAEEDAIGALVLSAHNADAHYWRALALRMLGRPFEALEHLRLGAESYPHQPYGRRCQQALAES